MATAKIFAGNCNFTTYVTASNESEGMVHLTIESECPHIQKIAEELTRVNPFNEISFHSEHGPQIMNVMRQSCPHASCPVFSGIIRAVEVEAGLALPTNISIELES